MDKSPDAYRTISEVAEDLDVPQHVLRFWETRFSQIKPLKRGGGRRYYRPDDIDLVKGIKHLLYGTGFTIKGVQRILKDQGIKHVQSIGRTGQAPVTPAGKTSPAQVEEERVFDSPLVMRLEPQPEPEPKPVRPATPGSAEDLAALIAPGFRAAVRAPKRKVPQLGLFGDDDQSEGGALSPQAMARMLPSAWQSATSLTGQSSVKLEAALAELEECSRLISTARMVASGDDA